MARKYDDELFQDKMKSIEQKIIFYKNYDVIGDEGPYTILKRRNQIIPAVDRIDGDYFSKIIKSKLFFKNDESKFMKENERIRLATFKNHFLLHKYQEITDDTDIKEIPNELKDYLENCHISIAKLRGYNLYDPNGKEIPCILTKRPINGSLYTYYKFLSSKKLDTSHDYDLIIDKHFTKNELQLTPENKFLLILGIVAGIEFIHEKDKVYVYLNPTTVYLNKSFRPIICGCGIFDPQEYDDETRYNINFNETNPSFMAPEVLKEKHVYQKSDVFSLGMMIYYILTGEMPFDDDPIEIQRKKVCEGKMPTFSESFSSQWKQIILRCCELNPQVRYSSSEILSILLEEQKRNDLISSISDLNGNTNSKNEINFSENDIQYISKINSIFKFKSEIYDSFLVKNIIENFDSLDEDVKAIIKLASQNDADSIEAIATYFLEGENGFQKDEDNALLLFRKAASLGSPSSAKKTAKLYQNGIGTDKNLERALFYNNKAFDLYKDDPIEQDIIRNRINQIKEEMKKLNQEDPKPEKIKSGSESNDDDDNDDDNDDDENNIFDTINQINKLSIKFHKIPSSTTEEDIKAFFDDDFEDLKIEIICQARFTSAKVTFKNEEDKKRFCQIHNKTKPTYKIGKSTVQVKLQTKREDSKNKKRKEIKKKKSTPMGSYGKSYKSKSNSSLSKSIKPKNTNIQHTKPSAKSSTKFSMTTKPSTKKLIPSFQINLKDYYPGKDKADYELIGSGSYSDVYKVYRKKDDVLFVAKIFKNEFSNAVQRKEFKREIQFLVRIEYPLVVKLIGYNKYSLKNPILRHATMIMEFEPNGTLAKMIDLESKKEAPIIWDNTMKIKTIIGIVKAMSFVHDQSIIHRDLKPENIFFDRNFNIKIGDFGSARKFDSNEISMTLNVGTPSYAAPEVIDENTARYSYSADVFSFGIILYQIVTGQTIKQIYKKTKKLSIYAFYKRIIEGMRPQIPEGIDENLVELMKQCWSSSIDVRPSFKLIFLTLKAIFEYDEPPTTFLPGVEIESIRKYLKVLDSYD